MKADAGFVENVKDAHELTANLRGKANTLTLASRKAHRRTRKGKIVKPDIEQELQSCLYLFSDFCGNSLLALADSFVQTFEPFVELIEFKG